MSTTNRPLTPAQKRVTKTLLCLVLVFVWLVAADWVARPVEEPRASVDVEHDVHMAHMSNFNWTSALSMAHER